MRKKQNGKKVEKTLKLKKVARLTTTVLLIVLVSLPIAAFQVPSVSAHEDEHVHKYMSEQAWNLLEACSPGSAMSSEISSWLERIKDGSYYEDHHDHVYGIDTYGIMSIPHYWDADLGPNDGVKDVWGSPDQYPNAYQKACALFDMALEGHSENPPDLWRAYERLGHAVHLIEDQTVPAHVHEDFHPDIPGLGVVGGGDDCFEKWMAPPSGGYEGYGFASALAQGGLITFPDEVKAKMHNGDWQAGLYYLMYTTNQYADYFASDDADGDTDDPEGWIDYSNSQLFRSSPTRQSDLEKNDWKWVGPFPVDDNNNNDGDLGRIASCSFVYGIRAVATLYKMFYELTNPPTGTITIRFADYEPDGKADYKWVSLDLTYDVGASEYAWDLECRFKNEGDLTWTSWESVRPRKSWILSEGNGPKRVYYQLRNLMGNRSIEYWAEVTLDQTAIPQVFNYEFSATGLDYPYLAQVDFYIHWISTTSDRNFYFDTRVEDEQGNTLLGGEEYQAPYSTLYYKCKSGVSLDLTQLTGDDVGTRGAGWSSPGETFDWSWIHSVSVVPGQTVRLCTQGHHHIPAAFDEDLNTVWTPTCTVPSQLGTHILFDQWCNTMKYGDVNQHYAIYVGIVATVTANLWEGYEVPSPNEAAVGYGQPEQYMADASLDLTAPADQYWPYPQTTIWYAHIVPRNLAIGYRMDGRSLYAWTKNLEPDIVIAVLGPVDFNITDPNNNMISSKKHYLGHTPQGPIFVWELKNNVSDASILREIDWDGDGYEEPIDLNGDGVQDTLIVFDKREIGDYQVQVAPSILADPAETYSIAVLSSALPNKAGFLSQDVPLSEIPAQPLIMKSTADGKLILPPHADAGGPYRVTEGTPVEFDASGSTDPDPIYTSALLYRWDFENDGTWDTTWSSIPTASHVWDDDWTGTAKVMVRRINQSSIATSIATVLVSNAAPTVEAGPDQTASPGDTVQFSGSFTEPPGVTDTTDRIIWDFGDGVKLEGLTLTPTHFYFGAKTYTVTLTVIDDDGGIGRDTLTVNTGVEVSIDPPQAVVPPGDDTTYNVIVHHLGKTADTYNLNLYGLDSAWYSLSTSLIQLGPGQTASLALEVTPPSTAQIGTYGFTVVASSQTDPTIINAADAEALVATAHDLGLEEIPPVTHLVIGEPKYVDPLNTRTYVTSATSFTLTAEDNPGGTGLASTFYHILNATHDTGRLKYITPFCLTGISDGQYSIVYYSKDRAANKEVAKSEPVTLDNTPPTITMAINPVSINTPVTLTATVDDSQTGGCKIASAQYSVDGGNWIPMNALDGNFDETTEEVTATLNPIPTPNVFAIFVRGTDALGNQNQLLTLLAVYDPAAGFVTGAGWINSPLGAYSADPTLTGKATFAFVSRYQKGTTTPTGHTEFQFHAGDLHFQSSTYEWLVVAGSRTQFKGSGTINGAGNYGFMITAIDGQINGGGGIDKFRIKIWDKATGIIIYDNQTDDIDTGNPTTAIAAGNILIHT